VIICYTANRKHREVIAAIGGFFWEPMGCSDCQWLVPGTFGENTDVRCAKDYHIAALEEIVRLYLGVDFRERLGLHNRARAILGKG
jgi:hypothetical protein